MPPKKTPKPVARYCAVCHGHRLHAIEIIVAGIGKQRMHRCTVCSESTPAAGIHCPQCAGMKFYTWKVEHPCPGLTIRIKRCRDRTCTGRLKTAERVARGSV